MLADLDGQGQWARSEVAEATDSRVRKRNFLLGAAIILLDDGCPGRVEFIPPLQVLGLVGQLAHADTNNLGIIDLEVDGNRDAVDGEWIDGLAKADNMVHGRNVRIGYLLPCLV